MCVYVPSIWYSIIIIYFAELVLNYLEQHQVDSNLPKKQHVCLLSMSSHYYLYIHSLVIFQTLTEDETPIIILKEPAHMLTVGFLLVARIGRTSILVYMATLPIQGKQYYSSPRCVACACRDRGLTFNKL